MTEAKQFGIEFGRKRPEHLQMVDTPGNNTVAVAEYGSKNGKPVLLLPGTHGSRTGPLIVNESTLHHQNIRLFSIDPYGWGYTPRREGHVIADIVPDIRAIIDHFDPDSKWCIAGRSAGGTYALASASEMPDRFRKAATMCTPSPKDEKDRTNPQAGKGWYQEMPEENMRIYSNPLNEDINKERREIIRRSREDPEYYLRDYLWEMLTKYDKTALEMGDIYNQQKEAYREAMSSPQSYEAWFDLTLALHNDWRTNLERNTVPTVLWHGAEDVLMPVYHARRLKARMPNPNVRLVIEPKKAHFNAFDVFPRILDWFSEK